MFEVALIDECAAGATGIQQGRKEKEGKEKEGRKKRRIPGGVVHAQRYF